MNIEWKRYESEKYSDWYVAIPVGVAAITRITEHHMWEAVVVMNGEPRCEFAISFEDAKHKAEKLIKENVFQQL